MRFDAFFDAFCSFCFIKTRFSNLDINVVTQKKTFFAPCFFFVKKNVFFLIDILF